MPGGWGQAAPGGGEGGGLFELPEAISAPLMCCPFSSSVLLSGVHFGQFLWLCFKVTGLLLGSVAAAVNPGDPASLTPEVHRLCISLLLATPLALFSPRPLL